MKNIYHLHIPKTGGRYIAEATISFLNYDCQLSGIDPRYALNTKHGGWKGIDDDTYVYTTFRNPVERTISHYVFFKQYLWADEPEKIKEQIFEDLKKPEYEYLLNYQTKFICEIDENIDEKIDQNFEYDMYLLDERLSRINFVLKTEDISDEQTTQIYRECCDWLGIDPVQKDIISVTMTENIYSNTKSKEILDILTEDEVNQLIRMNYNDYELYTNLVSGSRMVSE